MIAMAFRKQIIRKICENETWENLRGQSFFFFFLRKIQTRHLQKLIFLKIISYDGIREIKLRESLSVSPSSLSFFLCRPFSGRSSSSRYDPDLTLPTYPDDRENLDRHLTRAPSHARVNSRSADSLPQPKRRNVVKVTNGRARGVTYEPPSSPPPPPSSPPPPPPPSPSSSPRLKFTSRIAADLISSALLRLARRKSVSHTRHVPRPCLVSRS